MVLLQQGWGYVASLCHGSWFKAEFRGDEFYEPASEVVMWDPEQFVCRPLVVTNVKILDKEVFCIGRYGITVFTLVVVA
jgi:hypothetical protein